VTAACNRTSAADIAAYLDDPSAPRWRDLNEHAATCAACNAELAAWKCLRADLAVVDEHPSEEQLLAYAETRKSLAPDELNALAHHLAECASCRDEIVVLESVRIEPPPQPRMHREPAKRASFAALIGRILWHPAFAYAVVVALLVQVFTGLDRPVSDIVSTSRPSEVASDVAAPRDRVSQLAKRAEAEPPSQPPAAKLEAESRPLGATASGAAGGDRRANARSDASLEHAPAPRAPAAPEPPAAAKQFGGTESLRALGYLDGDSASMARRESPPPTAYGPATVRYFAGGRQAITSK
jgi:hypothetical protein